MADRIHPASADSRSSPSPSQSPSAPILSSKRGHRDESDSQKGASGAYPPYPGSYAPPHKRRRGCGCCCFIKSILVSLVLLVLALGITALVFWLVLRPVNAPEYSVQDVSIQRLNVNPNSTLDSVIAFTVRTENPNKKIGIYYDKIDIFLHYAGVEVAASSIDPFYQGHRNVTFLRSNLVTDDLVISEQLATSLRSDISSQKIPFQVRVRVKARVKIGALKSPKIKVRSNCDVEVTPPGAPSGARLLDKRCKLKVRL